MDSNLAAVAPSEHSSLSLPPGARRARQSGRLHPRLASCLAFLAAVFVSLLAAATVASHDVPLMLGGL